MNTRIAAYARLPLTELADYDRHYAEATRVATDRIVEWLATPGLDYVNSVSSFGVTPKVPVLLDLCLEQVEARGIVLGHDIHKASIGSMRAAGVLKAFQYFLVSPRYQRGIVSHDRGEWLDLFLLERGEGPGIALSNYRSRRLHEGITAADVVGPGARLVDEVDFASFTGSATLYAVLDGWMAALDAAA